MKKINRIVNTSLLGIALLSFSAMVHANGYRLSIEMADGSVHTAKASGYSIGLEGEPSAVTLLLPAVQSAREVSRSMHRAAASGEIIPSLIIESKTDQIYLSYQLENVVVKSWSMSGDSDADSVPMDEFSIAYTTIEYSFNNEIMKFDCTSGVCLSASRTLHTVR